jgi:hypothetical protein
MYRSRQALLAILARHDAIVKDVTFSHYAYWRVTFSAAPGVDLSVMVWDAYIDAQSAIDQAIVTLRSVTGQNVRR